MLSTVDQLFAGESYNVPDEMALRLISDLHAESLEARIIGPLEIKPTGPTEVKVKKNSRARREEF